MLKIDGPLLSRRDGRSDLVQALCPLAQWEQFPLLAPYIQITYPCNWWAASQEVGSMWLYTYTLTAGRKGSVQGKIYPRTSGLGDGRRMSGRPHPLGCRPPVEASLHPWVTVALPEGPILHPLQGNQAPKPGMCLLAPFLLQDPHLHSGSICTPQHSGGGAPLPAAHPAAFKPFPSQKVASLSLEVETAPGTQRVTHGLGMARTVGPDQSMANTSIRAPVL